MDGWIRQAKALQGDIADSQEAAKNIVSEARHGEKLGEEAADAAGKVHLLNGELEFNKSLVDTLERLQEIRQTLDLIESTLIKDRPLEVVELIKEVEVQLSPNSALNAVGFSGVLRSKVTDLREQAVAKLTLFWNNYISVEDATSTITVRRQTNRAHPTRLEDIAGALSELGMFSAVLMPLSQDIERLILLPRLQLRSGGTVAKISLEKDRISAAKQTTDLSAQSLFSDLEEVIDFFKSRLPKRVMEPLASQLIPVLTHRLITTWLASSVPEDLDGMEDFQGTMDLANNFANKLREYRWSGTRELADWMGSIPDIWLRKRQEISLSQVRTLLSKGFGVLQTVERVETQILDQDEDVLAGEDAADEWNDNWSDKDPSSPVKSSHVEPHLSNDGEEDVSAWGLDDEEKDHSTEPHPEKPSTNVEDEADAWGWNEDDHDDEPKPRKSATKRSPKDSESNGVPRASQKIEKAVTLKETYTTTSLPKEILDIISEVISDAFTLESPSQASFPVASAASDLLSLPGLILAMYRASASNTYTFRPNGSMLLYNDSLWLAEQLRHKLADLKETTTPIKGLRKGSLETLNLEAQILALESHGKRAYTKEMESQRTIITDLLDGAQGFSHCTAHPFNQECDIAISSTVDRHRLLYNEWCSILSQSALLQSIGSLLTTVTSKIIMEIEDKPDISAPESQQLTKYCNRIATLEDLFIPKGQADNDQAVPATAFYVSNWFKFQYLTNILDSSLADIKYLWTESELSLEFQADEIVELIMALFEDSEIRRKSIGEIRSSRLHRR